MIATIAESQKGGIEEGNSEIGRSIVGSTSGAAVGGLSCRREIAVRTVVWKVPFSSLYVTSYRPSPQFPEMALQFARLGRELSLILAVDLMEYDFRLL